MPEVPRSSVQTIVRKYKHHTVCEQGGLQTWLLHLLSQEEWAKIHPTYCGKLVEGYPKSLTQVKQFKGNATKY